MLFDAEIKLTYKKKINKKTVTDLVMKLKMKMKDYM